MVVGFHSKNMQVCETEAIRSDNCSMGILYLVRHGQASFGAENYDVLSELGYRQAVRLGEYFKYKGVVFDAALTGTLSRQKQTFAAICEGMGTTPGGTLQALEWPGLNEYDSEAVIAAIHPHKLERPTSPEMYRSHFRLLKDGLAQWMAGVTSPRGMPSYNDFVAGITSALDHVRKNHEGSVLLVSSGGPIATAVGHVLGTSAETTIELNLRIRNASVTEFAFTPKRHMLVTYNTLPHLDAPEHAEWVTYS
jgi:broad specificity phosphatase PhoE